VERASLILSVNRALWGEVGPNLRAVTAGSDGKTIRLRFFIDGEPSERDRESAGRVGAEVIADFPTCDLVEEEVVRINAPERIPWDDQWLTIFERREPP